MRRGDIHWADLGTPTGSSPGKRRPVLIVQADSFNTSRIGTVVAAVVTTNQQLAAAPGNIALARRDSKLPKDSVVNVSQIVTIDKTLLGKHVSSLTTERMNEVSAGLRLVLEL